MIGRPVAPGLSVAPDRAWLVLSLDAEGEMQERTEYAVSEQAAMAKVAAEGGMFPFSAISRESSGAQRRQLTWREMQRARPKPGAVLEWFNTMAANVSVGSLHDQLVRSANKLSDKRMRAVVKRMIGAHAQRALRLNELMARCPEAFEPWMVRIVRIGIAKNQLETVLYGIATVIERQQDNGRATKLIFAHPKMALWGVVGFLWIVDHFMAAGTIALFNMPSNPSPMPFITAAALGLAHLVGNPYTFAIGVLLLVGGKVVFGAYGRTPAGRITKDQIRRGMPYVGPIYRKEDQSIVARMVAILDGAKAGRAEIVRELPEVCTSPVLVETLYDVEKNYLRDPGQKLSQAFERTGEFYDTFLHYLENGEASQVRLGELMTKCADTFDKECALDRAQLNETMGPVLLYTVAGFVIVIMLAVLGPSLLGPLKPHSIKSITTQSTITTPIVNGSR